MTLDESIQRLRLRVMRRAEQVGNVSQVCRESGSPGRCLPVAAPSRALWRRRAHPRRTQAAGVGRYRCSGHRAPRAERGDQCGDLEVQPDRGPCGPDLAVPGRALYRAADPAPRGAGDPTGPPGRPRAAGGPGRWGCSPNGPGVGCGAPGTARYGTSRPRRPASSCVSIRSYIGKLKGVGKVWQITACDAFGSYGVAWLLPAFTATAAAHLPAHRLAPALSTRGLVDSARPDRRRLGVQGRLR